MNIPRKRIIQSPFTTNGSFLTNLFVVSIFLIAFSLLVKGHSFLVEPSPDWKIRGRAHCRRGGPAKTNRDNCAGPCISSSSIFFDKSAKVTRWRRGEIRKARWTRNNHRRGFVRLSLVRRADRMSDNAHEIGAFHFSCFESHPTPCNHEKVFCGTDVILHETSFTVPCVPDGDYVLGWSWFGGYVKGGRERSLYNFGDYWSCSFIRIEGGIPVNSLCRLPPPKFISGTKQSQCEARSNRVGMCLIEPCKNLGGSALLCPDTMMKIGDDCIPYYPRKSLVHLSGTPLKNVNSYSCPTYRTHTGNIPHIYEFLVAFLDREGHLASVNRVCDTYKVSDVQLQHGMTIIAMVAGSHKALLFKVDGTAVYYGSIQPYSIVGKMNNNFGRFTPPRYNSFINITASIQVQNGSYLKPEYFRIIFNR